MINITGIDLIKFIQKVYELSVPQGLGMLHYQEGTLTDEEAKSLIQKMDNPFDEVIVNMDYIRGRACKMTVFKKNGKLTIHDSWYDHTDEQLKKLLSYSLPDTVKLPVLQKGEHGVACNCADCIIKRGGEVC